ncbi:MAG: ABC transporter permease [Candidatus Gallimonas sp.]
MLFVFHYMPLVGLGLAFKDADYKGTILEAFVTSEWVGFAQFKAFFNDPDFVNVLVNTICLNLLMLLINFPAPIIFALLLNEVHNRFFKKGLQTVATFPHFISWSIFGGIVIALIDPTTGIMNPILPALGLSSAENPVYLGSAEYFWPIMIIASLIKNVGWGSIVYLAAIASIPQELYEAAAIDGSTRFTNAIYITLPSIAPTISVFLLLNVSRLLGNSFEQFDSMQNVVNLSRSEVLATFIYRTGISARRYSYTTAVGLFESVVSIILLVTSNFISKKTTGRGIL